ncbi:hypothetical protein [Agarilytica rhodophyticola]|uniref:hypothetical protein n=1 Tax=Agarilytica rhodophyticola TaxID=1737490 RepID=UPI000B341933|nr:hypothetical protein [Agarilytica rhodophyticola]
MILRKYSNVVIGLALGITIYGDNVQGENKNSAVDNKGKHLPTVEVVASLPVRPGNLSITPSGRILFTNSPLASPEVKVAELMKDGTSKPYPNAAFAAGKNSKIKGAIGIRTTNEGITWLLDMPTHTFYAIDNNTDKVTKIIELPEAVVKPTSFLQDFALDQKRNRAIIADMTQGDLKSPPTPAFISVDLKTGAAKRIAEGHASMMPADKGGFALNPITIDPQYDFIYFGALNGKTIYRVPASAFNGDGSAVSQTIEPYGPKTSSDGISIDGSGNVYITDVEHKGYGVTTTDGYRQIAKLPKGQSWPDGLSFGVDGYVYGTVDQLDRTAALSGKETGTGEYLIIRFKPVAPGKRGR